MHDRWCRRLAVVVAVWIAVGVALQLVVSLALR
jgi:hypothetical protein